MTKQEKVSRIISFINIARFLLFIRRIVKAHNLAPFVYHLHATI